MLSEDEILELSWILSEDQILEIEQNDKNYEEILDDLFKQHKNCYAYQILGVMPIEKITKEIVNKAIETDGSNYIILGQRGIIQEDEKFDLIKKALNSNILSYHYVYGYSYDWLDIEAMDEVQEFVDKCIKEMRMDKELTPEQLSVIDTIYLNEGKYGIFDERGETSLLGNTKFYAYMDDVGACLLPTARKGEKVEDYDYSYREDEEENETFTGIVYSVGLPIEVNKKLLESYLHNKHVCSNAENFIDYHLYDLIDCLGGKEGLINFVKENESFLGENTEEYLEQLSKDIDEVIKRKEEYTSAKIAEGISPREGEIQEVLMETVQNKDNEKSETIEKPGEEQGDN